MAMQQVSWEGPFSQTEVANSLKMALFGPSTPSITQEALCVETLRVAVWAASVQQHPPTLVNASIPTRQILHHARTLLAPFALTDTSSAQHQQHTSDDAEDSVTELERSLLDALEEQGDLRALSGGQWLPAPIRLVPITPTHYLLVGGIPTSLLPTSLSPFIHFHGSFRHIQLPTPSTALPTTSLIEIWQFQSLPNWQGTTPASFSQLLHTFHATALLPVTPHATIATMEAYIPTLPTPQAQRWLTLSRIADGRYLLRTAIQWGKRDYTIGVIQQNQLLQQSEPLHLVDIRRLCYALDDAAHTPTSVDWHVQRGTLVLRSELPSYERKLLASLASLQVPKDAYYPRTWTQITPQYQEIIAQMLKKLGIRINTGHMPAKEH